MHHFFIQDIQGNQFTLQPEESQHCAQVLRLKNGEEIMGLDGKGKFIKARLLSTHPKQCIAEIISTEENKPLRPFQIHLAIAPTKNIDRIEWMLEKAVEIGIDSVHFLLCKNSERKIIKLERLEKIVQAATKQSQQAYLPKIHDLTPFPAFIEASKNQEGFKGIAWCETHEKKIALSQSGIHSSYLLLIGPEGDFQPQETALAMTAGFIPVGLGPTRLRTETAGLYGLMHLSLLPFPGRD